jgi:regulation of enolase protein 1 (concanavalin A-like superfamily)
VKALIRLLLLVSAFSAPGCAGVSTPSLQIPGLPGELVLINAPSSASVSPEGVLTLAAPGRTNLFNSPNGTPAAQNAPMALFEPGGDFVLSARVSAELKAVYDVAALVLYENKDSWAKLCFENSVDKQALVVSVVTRGLSDDCNSAPVGAPFVYLALVKKGEEYSFHSSPDGKTWKLVRHFNFHVQGALKVGFAVHGSVGQGLEANFSSIVFSRTLPERMRLLR